LRQKDWGEGTGASVLRIKVKWKRGERTARAEALDWSFSSSRHIKQFEVVDVRIRPVQNLVNTNLLVSGWSGGLGVPVRGNRKVVKY